MFKKIKKDQKLITLVHILVYMIMLISNFVYLVAVNNIGSYIVSSSPKIWGEVLVFEIWTKIAQK